MSRLGGLLIPLAGLLGMLTGCATDTVTTGGGAAATIVGSVTYRERMALPPTAIIKVQLVDVSRADAPAVVLGEQVIEAAGQQVPFAFAIPYDPAMIDERMTYAVQARIEDGGRLLFINDQHYGVITHGAASRADLVLKAVAPPGAP